MRHRYLVTGADGFTGRILCQILREEMDAAVVGVDHKAGAGIQEYDLSDQASVAGLLKEVRPTRIFHCAGSFCNSWDIDFQTNVVITRYILESVILHCLTPRVLLIGSAAEYGNVPLGGVMESAPLLPVSVYGMTKVMQTTLMDFYTRNHGMDLVMARAFNLYGEGCSPLLLPGRVLEQAKRVQEGLQTKIKVRSLASSRDYLPVRSGAMAYLRIMEHGVRGEVYNVGCGRPVKIKQLIQNLLASYGLTLEDIEVLDDGHDDKTDVPVIYADIRKLNALPAFKESAKEDCYTPTGDFLISER